jgi:hypothetical protein
MGIPSPSPKQALKKIICSYAALGGDKPDFIVKCPTEQNGQRVMSLPVSLFIKSTAERTEITVAFAPVSALHNGSFFFLTADARNP